MLRKQSSSAIFFKLHRVTQSSNIIGIDAFAYHARHYSMICKTSFMGRSISNSNNAIYSPVSINLLHKFASSRNFSSKSDIVFTEHQLMTAATWWAQFLPGVKKVSFEALNQYAKIQGQDADWLQFIHHLRQSEKTINQEQFETFIKSLMQNIKTLHIQKEWGGLYYIQLGHESIYEPPNIVEQALLEAKISNSAFGLFPFKTEMRIYHNGHIKVGRKVYTSNQDVAHYDLQDENLCEDFQNASYMVIRGAPFRLVTINLDALTGSLYFGSQLNLKPLKNIESDTFIYITLHLRNFNGSEHEFLQFSDKEWIDILQDRDKIKEHFTSSAFFYYKNSKEKALEKNSFIGLGEVMSEELHEGYYRYTTGPVKMILAPQDGTVGEYLIRVRKHDCLIRKDNENVIRIWTEELPLFEARLCDSHGKILSDKVYKPDNVPGEQNEQQREHRFKR